MTKGLKINEGRNLNLLLVGDGKDLKRDDILFVFARISSLAENEKSLRCICERNEALEKVHDFSPKRRLDYARALNEPFVADGSNSGKIDFVDVVLWKIGFVDVVSDDIAEAIVLKLPRTGESLDNS